MAEYIERDKAIEKINAYCELRQAIYSNDKDEFLRGLQTALKAIRYNDVIPNADVQEKRYCKMIPLEPDCRNYTDVFICTNCHTHIHLGFIRKEYSGSYCLECGAEVMDGDTNG